jgi:hypothetical protein
LTALGLAGGGIMPSNAWAALSAPLPRLAKGPHPKPRPGIDASKVLAADALEENPKAAPVFDMVRAAIDERFEQ